MVAVWWRYGWVYRGPGGGFPCSLVWAIVRGSGALCGGPRAHRGPPGIDPPLANRHATGRPPERVGSDAPRRVSVLEAIGGDTVNLGEPDVATGQTRVSGRATARRCVARRGRSGSPGDARPHRARHERATQRSFGDDDARVSSTARAAAPTSRLQAGRRSATLPRAAINDRARATPPWRYPSMRPTSARGPSALDGAAASAPPRSRPRWSSAATWTCGSSIIWATRRCGHHRQR